MPAAPAVSLPTVAVVVAVMSPGLALRVRRDATLVAVVPARPALCLLGHAALVALLPPRTFLLGLHAAFR